MTIIPSDITDAINKKYYCEACSFEPRRKLDRIGRPFWVEQCTQCGDQGKTLKKDSLPCRVLESPVPFDEVLPEARAQARHEEFIAARDAAWEQDQRVREEAHAQYTQRYHDYLRTPQWRAKCTMVMRRDRGLCRGCLESPATVVHHLTYERIYQEPLFDLVALCRPCHARIHQKEGAA